MPTSLQSMLLRRYPAATLSSGGDGAQLFDNKRHGAIIWGLKLQDRDPTVASKDDTWAPLGVVQGPTEPKNMASILGSVQAFFMAHDPGFFFLI